MGSVTALLFNCLLGVLVCSVLGCNAAYGMGAGAASVALGSFMPGAGCLCAGVYTEVWTGELVKALKKGMMASFLNGLPDYSSKVNNDVIHMVDVGGDPDVLVLIRWRYSIWMTEISPSGWINIRQKRPRLRTMSCMPSATTSSAAMWNVMGMP